MISAKSKDGNLLLTAGYQRWKPAFDLLLTARYLQDGNLLLTAKSTTPGRSGSPRGRLIMMMTPIIIIIIIIITITMTI